ncbi:MAG TPA: hypothetical protein VHW67_04580 [Solirubrobacteraceae bacterium]|nr:hypothetical protein [Solirubrobacteraceae bacterium]
MTGRRWAIRGVAVTIVLAAGLGVGVALAGSGGLDPSFGVGGTTVLERPTSTYPTEAGLASGGKIVAVSTSDGVITVSRLLPNGAPDPTFDGDGKATIESAGFPSARALALQPDGKILLIGFTNMPGPSEDATVWRLKADGGSGGPNGALDNTFGKEGVVQIGTFTNTVGLAIAVQSDGKIVAAGRGFNTTGPQRVAVWRLTEGGALDPGFDTDGTAEVNDTTEDSVNAIALAPDGKILIAGTTELSSAPRDAVIWRLKANGGTGALNGALDPTFDTDGQADFDSGGDDSAEAIALKPDGKIILAGTSEPTTGHQLAAVWRVKPDGGSGVTNGALDPTFDTDGVAGIDGGGSAFAGAVALQPDGKILLAGTARVGANPSAAMLWRLTANGGTGAVNGALDPTFGTGGATVVSAPAGVFADALALGADRRIVVAGATDDEKLLLFRALGDPFALTVAKQGAGSGSVRSSTPGIDCGASCSSTFDDGTTVTLTAAPAPGSVFAGWSGAGCGGTGECSATMSADRTVTATFDALPTPLPSSPLSPSNAPKLANVSQSHAVWSEGGKLALASRNRKKHRTPRGTTFSYALDQQATVHFAFTQRVGGRRVKAGCVPQTKTNRHKRSCKRAVTRGTLSFVAHAGMNKLAFQGRLTRSRKLPLGRYTLIVTAKNSAGQRSAAQLLHFTIVA